jgi:dTDP-4-dehydrorhamnose 3,5-epimerase
VKFVETELAGVVLIEPDVFNDPRGYFLETYHAGKYADGGISGPFVQDNFSHSVRGTLRGLHYQLKHAQGKLVMALEGRIFDVAVDIRKGSPTFKRWVGVELSGENKRQLYIPPGFAHGFCVLSETADVLYKCTDLYSPQDERGVIWNDPALAIAWPIADPLVSQKDRGYRMLEEVHKELPSFRMTKGNAAGRRRRPRGR